MDLQEREKELQREINRISGYLQKADATDRTKNKVEKATDSVVAQLGKIIDQLNYSNQPYNKRMIKLVYELDLPGLGMECGAIGSYQHLNMQKTINKVQGEVKSLHENWFGNEHKVNALILNKLRLRSIKKAIEETQSADENC